MEREREVNNKTVSRLKVTSIRMLKKKKLASFVYACVFVYTYRMVKKEIIKLYIQEFILRLVNNIYIYCTKKPNEPAI